MKVYITKYALSVGIHVGEVDPEPNDRGYVKARVSGWWITSYKLGRDAFESLQDAMQDAEARRSKKIASLQKQIKKLESLQIKVKEGA